MVKLKREETNMAFDFVTAVSQRGGDDESDQQGAVDFVLTLKGDWV